MLHAVPLAGDLERIGSEGGAAAGQHVRDFGVEGTERVRQESSRRGCPFVPLAGNDPRTAADGRIEAAAGSLLASFAGGLLKGKMAVIAALTGHDRTA
ncbi:hypothetical protein [Methylobacterium sp. D54C]